MTKVRTRFAPSPTGSLHVGSVRTLLYAWFLARRDQGTFCLRIEDTDQERLVPGAIQEILQDLEWLGIDVDEGPTLEDLEKTGNLWPGAKGIGGDYAPYIQSLRLPRYKEVAEQLVAAGYAYRCDCTPERLEQERQEQMARKEAPGYTGYCRHRNVSADTKHVIRFIIPRDEKIVLNDEVKGQIVWEHPALRDTVILKSDGYPTYHLAAVCDDHDMGITHVLRGEEWIPTTPIHISLYKALGWEAPKFAHLPQVLGADGKKLSKRHGATSLKLFREGGYLPEALVNFLALIGWSPGEGDEQELFSKEEMIQKFSLAHVNTAGGVFAIPKLDWMNGMHIRRLSVEELAKRIRPFIEQAGLKVNEQKLLEITPHIQERMTVLTEAPGFVEFLFKDEVDHEIKSMFTKGIDAAKASEVLTRAREVLAALPDFDVPSVEAAVRNLAGEFTYPSGAIFIVVRIGVTGKKVTPPLFESISILGKEMSLKRIDSALQKLASFK